METNTSTPKKSSSGKGLIIFILLIAVSYIGYNHFNGKGCTNDHSKDSTVVAPAPVAVKAVVDTAKKAVVTDTTKKK